MLPLGCCHKYNRNKKERLSLVRVQYGSSQNIRVNSHNCKKAYATQPVNHVSVTQDEEEGEIAYHHSPVVEQGKTEGGAQGVGQGTGNVLVVHHKEQDAAFPVVPIHPPLC